MAQTHGAICTPEFIQGIEFTDGIKQLQNPPDHTVTNFRA
jgi:hypothetical protein